MLLGDLKNRLVRLLPASIIRKRTIQIAVKEASARGFSLISRDLCFDLVRRDTVLRVKNTHQEHLRYLVDNFDYFADSVIPLRVDGMNLIDISGPRYHRLTGFGTIPFLFPSLTEPYSTTAEYLDFAKLKAGETVLDLGAYAGVTTIIFAQLVGSSGRVYGFEADEVNFECARLNCEMAAHVMGAGNIELISKAVWSHNNGLVFSGDGSMGSAVRDIVGRKFGTDRRVESVRIQDFAQEQGISRIDFVKMDVEGAEAEVLKSSAGCLHELGARLIVEPHRVNGVLLTEECCRLLTAHGYKVHVRKKSPGSEALIEAVL